MGVAPGADLLTRRRLMSVDEVPLRIATSYFLPGDPETADLSTDGFIEGGLQEMFERHGRVFGRAEETLVARLPTSEESELLAIQPAEPVVEILRTSFDAGGGPVHTLQTICAASRHVFVVGQPSEDRVF
jgi:DNA-binding GntR family transcriptional regulator